MKKIISILTAVCIVALTFCGCMSSEEKAQKEAESSIAALEPLKVGISTQREPQFKIFDSMYSRIANKGYRVEYVEFATAREANAALANGEIDVSLIATKTEFDEFDKANPETLLNLGAAYYFHYGIFLCNFESTEKITDEATVAIPSDAEGMARALLLLEANGYITLKEGAGLSATLDDITENKRNFKFVTQSADVIANNLTNYENDIVVMSSQSAVNAGFSVDHTACAIEERDSLAAKAYSVVLLINRDDISSEKYTAVEPLYFSPLMYETIDIYAKDLISPSFSNTGKQ